MSKKNPKKKRASTDEDDEEEEEHGLPLKQGNVRKLPSAKR